MECAGEYPRWQKIAVCALILQPLIFYRRHLFSLTGHIPFDIVDFHLPLAALIERSLRQGVWPLWNPLEYCGVPIHADIQAQLFYPPAWLAMLADQITGGGRLLYWLEWLVSAHMIVAGIGAYFLLRRFHCTPLVSLYGASVFQIGPFFVSQAEHLGAVSAAAWFPIMLLCVSHLSEGFNSRWCAGLATSIAMCLLSGFPAAFHVGVVLSGLFAVALIWWRLAKPRLLAFFAAGCLLGVGITAIQLLPTIQLSTLSVASLRYKWLGSGGGLHWQSLVSFVWPNYYHIFSAWDPALYKLPYEFTFMYTFCGYLSLGLIAATPFLLRKSRLMLISATLLAVSTVWMLGEHTPVYPTVFKLLPHFVEDSLYAEYALLGFSLFAAITSALALAQFEVRLHPVLLLILIAANSWNLIRVGANRVFNSFPGSYEAGMKGWSEAGRPMPETLQAMTSAEKPPLRVELMSGITPLEQERPGLFGLASATGDNPFLLLRYYYLRRTYSDDAEWSRKQLPRGFDSPWLRALNIGYVLDNANAPDRDLPDYGYNLLPFRSIHAYKVHDPAARFYLQTHLVRAQNEQEALNQAGNPTFDPAKQTIVEGLDPEWKPDEAATGSVNVMNYENNRVELEVKTSGRVLLVTSEAFYPGWTATINGKLVRILATNVAFRGLTLEAGESHVVMQYSPQYFRIASAITCLSLVLTIFLFVY